MATAGVGMGPSSVTRAPAATSPASSADSKHVARHPGVLANQYMGLTLGRGEYPPGCPSELEHKVSRDRVFAHLTADAVGSKKLSAHNGWL